MTPLDFVHEIRLDQATFLLRTTPQSPESISQAVGYSNVSTLRALVRKRRGSTLTELGRGRSSMRGVASPGHGRKITESATVTGYFG